MERKERLLKVYEYLRYNGYVHTKKDMAAAIGKKATTLSRAFGGDIKALTDNLFKQIAATYRPMFSLEWLLTGTGKMLNKNVEVINPNSRVVIEKDEDDTDAIIEMYKSASAEKEKAKEIFESAEKARQEAEAMRSESESLRSEILSLRNELKAARNSMLEAAADFSSAAKQLRAISATLSVDYFSTGQLAADSLPKPSVATSAPSQDNNSPTPSSSGTPSAPASDKAPFVPVSAKSDSVTNNLSSTSKTSK